MELLQNDNWAGGRLEYPVTAIDCRRDAGTDEPEDAWEDFRTDCYITGKYQQELLDTGYFNPVLETLLEAGLEIHVYSESWQHSPFAAFSNLICHPELQITESLQVMQQFRISLNIMSWHKDGLTERILNTMLCQSVMDQPEWI